MLKLQVNIYIRCNLVFFSATDPKCFWSHFSQANDTVTASFNTTVRQMTEMFPWPICHSKKWLKCLSKKINPGCSKNKSILKIYVKNKSVCIYNFAYTIDKGKLLNLCTKNLHILAALDFCDAISNCQSHKNSFDSVLSNPHGPLFSSNPQQNDVHHKYSHEQWCYLCT